jgi:hypothetical protein
VTLRRSIMCTAWEWQSRSESHSLESLDSQDIDRISLRNNDSIKMTRTAVRFCDLKLIIIVFGELAGARQSRVTGWSCGELQESH